MKHLVVILLLLNFALLLADGVQPDGSGTENEPYQIETLDNLLWVSTNASSWSSYFIQTADIDASETENWNDGAGFSPIGNEGYIFSGCYDGQEYAIDSLCVIRTNESGVGMFGVCEYVEITNVTLTNAWIIGEDKTGGIIGIAIGCTVENCHTSGRVISWYYVTGGIVGRGENQTSIHSCSSTAGIDGLVYLGGILGRGNSVTISECWTDLNVSSYDDTESGESRALGGLVGYCVDSIIGSSHASGRISGLSPFNHQFGGLVGWCVSSNVSDCSFSGTISGSGYSTGGFGGIIGNGSRTVVSDCSATVEIGAYGFWSLGSIGGLIGGANDSCIVTRCFAASDISVESDENTHGIGGFVGSNDEGSIVRECYQDGEVEGGRNPGGFVGSNEGSARIANCYCLGDVVGTENPGGFAGQNIEKSVIEMCYSAGDVDGDGVPGGFAGLNDSLSVIEACFWNRLTCGLTYSDGGTGLINSQMRDQQTFLDAGWDFMGETVNGTEDIWGINPAENSGFPFLHWQGYVGIDEPNDVPSISATQLHGNYPNPFNPETTISFSVRPNDTATLAIYNLKGQKVKSCGEFQTGEYKIIWDGTNDALKPVASGVFMCRLKSKNSTQTRKLMLLK